MAVNDFGAGRCVYISGLPYSFENSRLLYRSILWSAHDEGNLHKWFSTNFNVEVHAYVKNGKYCVVNNTYEHRIQQYTEEMEAVSIFIWMQMKLSGTKSSKIFNRKNLRGKAYDS